MTDTRATNDPRLDKVEHTVVDTGPVQSLEEAARLRGVPEAAVIKTMVVRKAQGDFVLVLVPGDRVIDWPKLREAIGERRLTMADQDEALDATGYERGTITPLGAEGDWPVIGDTRLNEGTVSIGGGARGISITLDGSDLLSIIGASVVDVG